MNSSTFAGHDLENLNDHVPVEADSAEQKHPQVQIESSVVADIGEQEATRVSDDSVVAIRTDLDRFTQIEIGKITHSGAKKIVPLVFVVIIVLYNIANIFIMQDNPLFLSLISVGPCIVLFIAAFWGYYPVYLFKGQKEFNQAGGWPSFLIEFYESGFTTFSYLSGKTYFHTYDEITDCKQSPQFTVLLCDKTVVVLDMDNFIKGSKCDLEQLLKANCPHVKPLKF